MAKKIIGITLAIALCAGLPIGAIAAVSDLTDADLVKGAYLTDALDPKLQDSAVIGLPGSPGLEITVTGIYDTAQFSVENGRVIYVYMTDASTVTFNKDVTLGIEDPAKANVPVNAKDFPVGKGSDGIYDQYGFGYIAESYSIAFLSVYDGTIKDIISAQAEYGFSAMPLSVLEISSPGSSTAPVPPPSAPAAAIATPTASTVLVNGESVRFDAYSIANNNFFKLRDLAYVLSGTEKQFEVGWDAAHNSIALTSGEAYTVAGGEMAAKGTGDKSATPIASTVYLDGEVTQFTAYTIEGNNYFKLRDIGETFDFEIDWDGALNTITIDTSTGYTPD